MSWPLPSISGRRLLAALVVSIALLGATGRTAGAGVPDPAQSICPSSVSVSATGATCFDVVVKDFAGNPVAGSSVGVDFASCSITFCPAQPHSGSIVLATANGMGIAHFCICATVSGACNATIRADGIQLCTPPVAQAVCDAQVPSTMSYQGVLTDNGGGIPPDGTHNFVFAIYDDTLLSGAHQLWTESHNAIPVTRGGFSVILGKGTPPMPLNLAFDRTYYLTFSVDGGAELAPRLPLASSPYSLIARSVANCAVSGNGIAAGQVVKGLNALHDDVTLAAGSNVTITPSGNNTLTISATGGGIGGSGTTNSIPKFTGSTTLGNSVISESGGNVGIGNVTPGGKLDVAGNVKLSGSVPSSGTGFLRTMTPKNLISAWGLVKVTTAGAITIIDGFNVSSVTSGGSFLQISFGQALTSGNYAVTVQDGRPDTGGFPATLTYSPDFFSGQRDPRFFLLRQDSIGNWGAPFRDVTFSFMVIGF